MGRGTYKLEALLLEALDDLGNETALDAVPVYDNDVMSCFGLFKMFSLPQDCEFFWFFTANDCNWHSQATVNA